MSVRCFFLIDDISLRRIFQVDRGGGSRLLPVFVLGVSSDSEEPRAEASGLLDAKAFSVAEDAKEDVLSEVFGEGFVLSAPEEESEEDARVAVEERRESVDFAVSYPEH